jgi:hypothetical protein
MYTVPMESYHICRSILYNQYYVFIYVLPSVRILFIPFVIFAVCDAQHLCNIIIYYFHNFIFNKTNINEKKFFELP